MIMSLWETILHGSWSKNVSERKEKHINNFGINLHMWNSLVKSAIQKIQNECALVLLIWVPYI